MCLLEAVQGKKMGSKVLDVLEPVEESGGLVIKQASAVIDAGSCKCVEGFRHTGE